MREMKDTARALVRISYDGRVHKTFRGHLAQERFTHEVRVLRRLEERGCTFVPRLLEVEPENLKIVTTNCGTRVDQLNPDYVAVAKAFGCRTAQPGSLADFEQALHDAFAADRPTLIEMREDASCLA